MKTKFAFPPGSVFAIILFVTIVLLGATMITQNAFSTHKHHDKHSNDNSRVTTAPFRVQLVQLPSNKLDYSNGQSGSVHAIYVHGTIDNGGFWHVDGMAQNTGNKTIQMLTIIATIYNSAFQPVGSEQQPAIVGTDTTLRPGEQKPFAIFGAVGGQIPMYFKLGYNWQ